ncbi:MAG: hypothetical protein M1838_003776 [Thelocarpon superellum]|nr:MAG: hypothetical protein M1838_003776 [Thelocarpon superellum]
MSVPFVSGEEEMGPSIADQVEGLFASLSTPSSPTLPTHADTPLPLYHHPHLPPMDDMMAVDHLDPQSTDPEAATFTAGSLGPPGFHFPHMHQPTHHLDMALTTPSVTSAAMPAAGPATAHGIAAAFPTLLAEHNVVADPVLPVTSSYGQLVGNGLLAVDAYDSADMVDLDGFQLEDFERNLDFIRFVEQWYYRAGLPAGGYPSISEEAIEVRHWNRPSHVTRPELDGDRYDVQGIDWTKIGVARETARRVRRKLYHNYTNIQPRPLGLPWHPAPPTGGAFFEFRRLSTKNLVHLSHFQLRNLLCSTSHADLCYAGKSHITIANPATDSTRVIMDLSKPNVDSYYPGGWKTSTLTATHGVLVVGGFGGEYAMANLDAASRAPHVEGLVTMDDNGITNYVHNYLDRSSNHPRTVFCSNDRKVRVLDCYTNTFIKEHDFGWPVNCAATSPDGRLRVVVGDDTSVTVSDAETGRSLQVLRGHQDFGFACAWADDGIHVATGNQDKQVRIYDARYWARPLHIMYTEMAGARALRFSPIGGGKRVLAAAEPADFIHVVDAHHFRTGQRLDQFGEIAGITFAPDGNELYAANSDETLGGIIEYRRTGAAEEYGVRRCTQCAIPGSRGPTCSECRDWAADRALPADERVGRTNRWRMRRSVDLGRVVV